MTTINVRQFIVLSAVRRAVSVDRTAPVAVADELAELAPLLASSERSYLIRDIRADLAFDGVPREVDDAWRLAAFALQKVPFATNLGPSGFIDISPLTLIRAVEYAIGRHTPIVHMTAAELARIADQLDDETRESIAWLITERDTTEDLLHVEDRRDWASAVARLTPEYVPF
jgi:hypothetical protein